MLCAKATMRGIVIIERMVDIATKLDDKAVSLLNFAENIEVAAAIGALAPIITDMGTMPLSPAK